MYRWSGRRPPLAADSAAAGDQIAAAALKHQHTVVVVDAEHIAGVRDQNATLVIG